MCACVDVVPFGPRAGGGILPHEETFSGPKEDRMALMKATRTQLSPIFGLHADEKGLATKLLHSVMASRAPDMTATMRGAGADNVLHEVWTITDGPTIKAYQDALASEDIFIADLSAATVITMYLLPDVNLRLLPRLRQLKPGTRIVSHDWDMGDWAPERSIEVAAPDKRVGLRKTSRLMRWTV
jgi:hypothetical protein